MARKKRAGVVRQVPIRGRMQPVTVFEDPTSRMKEEGEAYVLEALDGPDSDGMVRVKVWFVDDATNGGQQFYERWVGVDQLATAGITA